MIALLATAVRAQDTEGKRDMRAGFPAPDPALTWMQDPHHAQGGLLAHSTAPAAVTAAAAAFPPGGGAPPWKGITCSNGAITQLALPNLGLAGTLPPQLAALRSLVQLDLSGNAFEGSIPSAWLAAAAFPSLADADLGGATSWQVGAGAAAPSEGA